MNKITRRSFLKRVSLELTAFVPAARSLVMIALPTKQGGSGRQVGNITFLAGVTLAGLALGADQQAVIARLGQATTVEQAHGSGMIEWHYPDISIRFGCIEQADPCGYCSSGSQPNGLPVFCDIRYDVQSYSALIINGYPHVMHAYSDAAGGAAGMKQAAIALGQGYEAGISLSSNYCTGGQTRAIDSSHPRLWATSKYNDGNGPGSSIYDTINANTCLSQYNYAQTTDPGVSLC